MNRVALLGAGTGGAALLLHFITLRPNRIVRGVPFGPAESAGMLFLLCCILLLSLTAVTALLHSRSLFYIIQFSAGVAIILCTLYGAAAAGRVLSYEEFPYGRVSLSGGFWLLLLSGYIIINGSAGKLAAQSRILRVFILLPIALLVFLFISGHYGHIGIFKEFHNQRDKFLTETVNHLFLSGTSVAAAAVAGIPLGMAAWRRKKTEKPVFALVNGIQTIPSLALFGLLIAPLAVISRTFPVLREIGIQGIGNTPALIALFLYALLPITRNTYAALAAIDGNVIEAGRGMGMNTRQIFRRIEVPLAVPVVAAGVRIAAVQTIGNTAVAALIGAGGLGSFIFQGLGQTAYDLIILGVIPIIVIAVITDRLFAFAIHYLTPAPMRKGYGLQ